MPGAMTFKHIAPRLVDKAFHVLVYDIYGRGYSESPKLTPEPTMYAIQLAMLLQYIGWNKVNVVGYSMGGSIAAAFGAWFPHLIDERIAFLAAAGLMDDPRFANESQTQTKPPATKFELISGISDAREFEKLQAGSLPGFAEVVKACMSGPLRQTGWAYDTLAKTDKKFLILHGTADQAIPFENAHRIQKIIPQAELLPIEGASHFFVMEVGAADKVADKLSEFFA
ncbi:hypothetical protein EIP86_008822 [Pleurotus ostreatoroseus]|nr:hypothetical protein EIP86_008822 [Pleurotus ostreatoroseus]